MSDTTYRVQAGRLSSLVLCMGGEVVTRVSRP
jgi:hypothetical protein